MKSFLHKQLFTSLSVALWLFGWLPVVVWLWPEQIWLRLELAKRGMPFAQVVDKQELDVFRYMDTDGFAIRSLVFADGRLVGYSFWAKAGFLTSCQRKEE